NLPNKRAFLAVDVIEELPAHEVFGPQGELVVSLIERAARLTSDEAKQLSEARGAVWLTARNAARYAARDTARDAAARIAAWGVARNAARFVVGDVAGDAAVALVVRDLIGSSGFTQTHYDALTGPWRRVVGRVHPDDAEFKFWRRKWKSHERNPSFAENDKERIFPALMLFGD